MTLKENMLRIHGAAKSPVPRTPWPAVPALSAGDLNMIAVPCILAVFLYMPVLAHAQQKPGVAPGGYPNKPIRVVVTIAAGGGPDTIVRIVGQIVNEKMGQPMVVDNRPGGGTVLATDLVAHAAPDGYTLLASTDTLLLVGAMKRVSYDVRKAFEPVVQMTAQWYVLVVNPSLPIKSVVDLIAYAKARPDALNYASQGVGTTGHLSMERFKSMAGVSMVHVPYKGAAPALLDIIGGQVQTMFSSTVSAIPHVASGKLRGIAVSSPKRLPFLPELPTVAESGVPDFRASNSYNLIAPAGTPRAILHALNDAIRTGLNAPAMVKRLAADGTEPAPPATPEEFKAMTIREYALVEKQVKGLSIKDF
jgi:tripartite-type tricarboxylate transporter receptor subunit TctC